MIRKSMAKPTGGLAISAQMAGISMLAPTTRKGTSGTPHSIAGRVQPLNTGSLNRFMIGFVSPGSRCRNQHRSDDRRAANEKPTDEHVRDVAKPSMLKHHPESRPYDRYRANHASNTEQGRVFSNSGMSLKQPGIGNAKRVDPL